MTNHGIRTGIVAPNEVHVPPNRVWSVFSQVLVKVLIANEASVLKIKDE